MTYLKRRGAQLLAGQTGLVVDIARGHRTTSIRPAAALPTERPGPLVPSPSLEPGSLAATVLAWLIDVAGADMQAYAPVVAMPSRPSSHPTISTRRLSWPDSTST